MPNSFYRKLQAFTDLDAEDLERLDEIFFDVRQCRAGDDLILEGDRPDKVFLLLEGWGFRYKLTAEGKRQILAYLVPGDLCDITIFILERMDHAIGLLSDARVALIEPTAMRVLLDTRPRIARALYWATLVDEAVLREWLVNVAQRDPLERIAHLFCELWLRMTTVGLVNGASFDLPLTQAELGDTVGLTPVTVNRVLQRLRADGLITLDARRLTIHDVARLKALAGFNDDYLHLERSAARARSD